MGETELIKALSDALTAQYQIFSTFFEGINLTIEKSIESVRLRQLNTELDIAMSTGTSAMYIATLETEREELIQRYYIQGLIVFIAIVLIILIVKYKQ